MIHSPIMYAALNETLEQLTVNDKVQPFKPARGPNSIFPSFDPSHRLFMDDSMIIEYNHDIPVRDGIKLRGDVFRPLEGKGNSTTKWPIVLAITPYGKQAPFDQAQIPPCKEFDPGYDGVHMSKFCVFEGSDPAFWTKHGFIYVAVDARGSFASEGLKATFLTPVDALDAYDVIEYLGTRPWSNGHVGMIGASALGAIQWYVTANGKDEELRMNRLAASLAPPHLSAIIVQDGWTDMYRELAYKGGVPHLNFMKALNDIWMTHGNGEGSLVGDLFLACQQHPTFDHYWKRLNPDVTNITCAVYVISSLADNGIHCPGSIRGYIKATAKTKFLELHPYRKWEWQLTPESLERQLAFFHRTLKGTDRHAAQSVDFWPLVRLHTTEKHYAGSWRSENEFPLARTIRQKFYLCKDQQLLPDGNPDLGSGSVTYDAKTGSASWQYTFSQPTEITGTSRLHLSIAVSMGNDADFFVTLQKLDRDGKQVYFPYHTYINDGHVAWGWLRTSLRKLDPNPVGDEVAHTFREEDRQFLEPNHLVEADIGIQPTSTLFRIGETLKVVVQGHDFGEYSPLKVVIQGHDYGKLGPLLHLPRGHSGCNEGKHTISLEGSYLEIPIIPPK